MNTFLILCLSGANLYIPSLAGIIYYNKIYPNKINFYLLNNIIYAIVAGFSFIIIFSFNIHTLFFNVKTVYRVTDFILGIVIIMLYCILEYYILSRIGKKIGFHIKYNDITKEKLNIFCASILEEIAFRFILLNCFVYLLKFKALVIIFIAIIFSFNHNKVLFQNKMKKFLLGSRFILGCILTITCIETNFILCVLMHILYNFIVTYIYPNLGKNIRSNVYIKQMEEI